MAEAAATPERTGPQHPRAPDAASSVASGTPSRKVAREPGWELRLTNLAFGDMTSVTREELKGERYGSAELVAMIDLRMPSASGGRGART